MGLPGELKRSHLALPGWPGFFRPSSLWSTHHTGHLHLHGCSHNPSANLSGRRLCRCPLDPRLPPEVERSNPEVGRGQRGGGVGGGQGEIMDHLYLPANPSQSPRLILPFVRLKEPPTTLVLGSLQRLEGEAGVGEWEPNPFLGELGAPRPPDHSHGGFSRAEALAGGAADGARRERRCPSLRLLYYWRHF